MTEDDRILANEDFSHNEPQYLLSQFDIQRLGSYAQLAPKTRQTFRKLEIFRLVHRRHLQ
jgi:hypothetical protein